MNYMPNMTLRGSVAFSRSTLFNSNKLMFETIIEFVHGKEGMRFASIAQNE